MTNIKNEYNPLSIEHQVKRRIEQKSSGVSLPDEPSHLRKLNGHSTPDSPLLRSSEDNDLSIHFMNLLFSDTTSAIDKPTTHGHQKMVADDSKKTGTNTFFYPLKKQEESNSLPTNQKQDFSLVIENADAGLVTLNGSWTEGIMKVHLHISMPLDTQQKQILIAILKKKLSHEIGTHMEIEID